MSSWDLPVSASQRWRHRHAQSWLASYVGAGDPNSVPDAHSTLTHRVISPPLVGFCCIAVGGLLFETGSRVPDAVLEYLILQVLPPQTCATTASFHVNSSIF